MVRSAGSSATTSGARFRRTWSQTRGRSSEEWRATARGVSSFSREGPARARARARTRSAPALDQARGGSGAARLREGVERGPKARGEALLLLEGGHLLGVNQRKPSVLIEFGMSSAQGHGVSRDTVLAADRPFALPEAPPRHPEDEVSYRVLAWWTLGDDAEREFASSTTSPPPTTAACRPQLRVGPRTASRGGPRRARAQRTHPRRHRSSAGDTPRVRASARGLRARHHFHCLRRR